MVPSLPTAAVTVIPSRAALISSSFSSSSYPFVSCLYSSSSPEDESTLPSSLILDDNALKSQMQKLRSKYPVSESAYLAAAKERSKLQAESKERKATDEDWKNMAREKAQMFGGIVPDDWEASQREAGNADSQILIPNPPSSSQGGADDEEPKLLLF